MRTAIGILVSITLIGATAAYTSFRWDMVADLKPNEYGDSLAGVAATLALLWLVIGYFQQGEELRSNTQALASQEVALKAQAEAMMAMAKFAEQQAQALRNQVQSQNLSVLFELLFSEPVAEGLARVRGPLRDLAYAKWTDEDKQAAAAVCGAYNLAAIMAHFGLIDAAVVVENWTSSLVDCHRILTPFLAERRSTNGESYWSGFSELSRLARARGGTPARLTLRI